jgi:uncharacterized membrane protein YbhN (UPF0104 family)
MFSKEKIWTTISSIVGFVLMALVVFGVISADQKTALHDSWQAIVTAIPGGDWTVIVGLVLVFIQQIVLIFTKDPKPGK